MIFLPPRHFKSEMVTVRYTSWRIEREPGLRVILGAYNQTLAQRFSRKVRRITRERVPLSNERTAVDDWETMAGGGLRAAGVGTGVTGFGAKLIVIDDPVKSREEAESETYRNKVYDWYTDDIYTRQEEDCAIIIIQTRWHEDDLSGRILASEDGPNWTVLSLPALAEEGDPLGREVGEALCPEHISLETLLDRQRVLQIGFYALYQQRPQPREGSMFKREWFRLVDAAPAQLDRVRYWDKAGAQPGKGDWTVGALMGTDRKGHYYIEDVVRGQWPAKERNEIILQTTQLDKQKYGRVKSKIEQPPGLAKESTDAVVQLLAGYAVEADPVRKDKVERAEPLAAQLQAGNVFLVKGEWNAAFINEYVSFPTGKNDDQVDGGSGGFNELALHNDGWLNQMRAAKAKQEAERAKKEN